MRLQEESTVGEGLSEKQPRPRASRSRRGF